MKIRPDHKHIPFGPYLSQMIVDDDFCKRLLKVGKTLTKKHNQYLAGNIDEEYVFNLKKDSWIAEEFKVAVDAWLSGSRQFSGDHKFQPTYKLESLWINFQKAGEYIPIHVHPNCDISFVLFLEVPKEMLAEKRVLHLPPGFTGFLYGEDVYGAITNRIIEPQENVLYMFPSNLRHCVAHFNSKVTRTSVSGNVVFDQRR